MVKCNFKEETFSFEDMNTCVYRQSLQKKKSKYCLKSDVDFFD